MTEKSDGNRPSFRARRGTWNERCDDIASVSSRTSLKTSTRELCQLQRAPHATDTPPVTDHFHISNFTQAYSPAPQITVFHSNLALYKFHYLLTY